METANKQANLNVASLKGQYIKITTTNGDVLSKRFVKISFKYKLY
jgi:hypothetical protein